MARSRPRLGESAAARCDGGWARESLCSIPGLKRIGAKEMKRLMDILVVVGATILTGGGGYIVVLGHVAKVNHASAYCAVAIAMVGAACLSIGLLFRNRD